MKRAKQSTDPVSATEVVSFVYCPEAWRLEHGLGYAPENRDAIEKGRRHHEQVGRAESGSRVIALVGAILLALAGLFLAFALLGGSP